MFIATCVLGILAVGAIASSPLYARRVASFGSKGLGAAFIALALAVGALSATTHLQSGPFICSFLLLLVGAVLVLAHWDGTTETELEVASRTKATIRCIPFDRKKEAGKCVLTGKPSAGRVVFAKAY